MARKGGTYRPARSWAIVSVYRPGGVGTFFHVPPALSGQHHQALLTVQRLGIPHLAENLVADDVFNLMHDMEQIF